VEELTQELDDLRVAYQKLKEKNTGLEEMVVVFNQLVVHKYYNILVVLICMYVCVYVDMQTYQRKVRGFEEKEKEKERDHDQSYEGRDEDSCGDISIERQVSQKDEHLGENPFIEEEENEGDEVDHVVDHADHVE
jgi:hypothetical protein